MRISHRFAAALLAGAMSLSLAATASAQKGQQGQKRAQAAAVAPAMIEKLDLSAEQRTKVQAAAATLKEETQKAQSLATPKEKRQALMQARQNFQSTVQSVLTPDQQKQLATMMANARDYKGLGPVGNQLLGMNLSDEQKEKIKAISAKYQPEFAKLQAARKDATDKAAFRGQMQDLQRKVAGEVKAVLTPEQQQQMTVKRGKKTAKR